MTTYLTERELAARWHVGKTSVRRLRDAGRLPFFRPSARKFLYRLEDVERYEREHTTDAVVVGLRRSR